MIKLSAATATALLSFGPAAAAADTAARLAQANWSGFYAGGQLGYARTNADYLHISTSGSAEPHNFQPKSPIGGIHAGWQHQWDSWVFGVEGSFNWARLDEKRTSVARPPVFKTFELDHMATVVGKAGYAFNNWLIYVKGGWAGANIRTEGTSPVSGVIAVPRQWENGLTVGGGFDYMIASGWILGVDFNYYRFNFDRSAVATNSITTHWSNASADVYAGMGRISYKFGP